MGAKYEKMENSYKQGEQIDNLNGRTYNVLEVYGIGDALLQDTKKEKEFVLVTGLQKFLKTDEAGQKYIGYEWSSGQYYSSLSQINFTRMAEQEKGNYLEKNKTPNIEMVVYYDKKNDRVYIEEKDFGIEERFNASTPSDIASAVSGFVNKHFSFEKNVVRAECEECVGDIEYAKVPDVFYTYRLSRGTGTAWLENIDISLPDANLDAQDVLDKVIDMLEEKGREDCFIKEEQLEENGGDFSEDEYVTGGNHGLHLYTHGDFQVYDGRPQTMVFTVIGKDADGHINDEMSYDFDSKSVIDFLKGNPTVTMEGIEVTRRDSFLPLEVKTSLGEVVFESKYLFTEYGEVKLKADMEKAQAKLQGEKKEVSHSMDDKSKKRDDESR